MAQLQCLHSICYFKTTPKESLVLKWWSVRQFSKPDACSEVWKYVTAAGCIASVSVLWYNRLKKSICLQLAGRQMLSLPLHCVAVFSSTYASMPKPVKGCCSRRNFFSHDKSGSWFCCRFVQIASIVLWFRCAFLKLILLMILNLGC